MTSRNHFDPKLLNVPSNRSSKPRQSKRATLFEPMAEKPEDAESEAEDKEHMVAEAGHSKYILRSGDITMHVPILEMIRCQAVLWENPKGDLNQVLATNQRLADGMNDAAVDKGVETVPWLRVYRPDYFAFQGAYPDLTENFEKLLQQILSNVFTDIELE